MNITKFEKVSIEQFKKDYVVLFGDETVQNMYEDILLPRRATSGSAGYDFRIPFKLTVKPQESIIVPTGIRCKMNEDLVLQIFPRSGLGFKYRIQLDNTVGIIDSDYYNAKNEGHIMIKISNLSLDNKTLTLNKGDAFAQGVFLKYYKTVDDDTDATRVGGMGSTDKAS